MKKNIEQEKAIAQLEGPVILISCPGSGKTTTLLRRINHMLEVGIPPKKILMITFTKAAAQEMSVKFKKKFGEPNGITFSTIHPLHRDDVIDEIWCVIFEQIDNYDCSKSSLTTFVLPWIRHVVTEYCSRNFHKTTSYYADGIRKVSAAMNYCQEKNIPSSIETLQKLTGLRIPTIKKCIDLLSKKDVVSYEVLSENGFEQSSSLSSPENIFLKNEETESFNHILEESLTEEELEIMILLLQPDNPAKLKASYREIAQKTHTNVPYVKDCISRATMKLKNNKELLRKYPNVIKMYDESMVGESAPVLDDGDLIKEQYEELSED